MNIAEIFYSIQGEGLLAGVPSLFIRFAGCNLRCAWCDSRYASWEPEGREMTLPEVLQVVSASPARHVVLTGGEPTLAPELQELAAALKADGRHITVETNGTTAPAKELSIDLASISPKLRHSVPDPERHPREAAQQSEEHRWRFGALRAWFDRYPCQFKFVVRGEEDLQEIIGFLQRLERQPPPDTILLMPEGIDPETLRRREPFIIEACKQHGFRYGRRLQVECFGHQRGT